MRYCDKQTHLRLRSDGLKTFARLRFWVFLTQVAICGNYHHCWPPQRHYAKWMLFSFMRFTGTIPLFFTHFFKKNYIYIHSPVPLPWSSAYSLRWKWRFYKASGCRCDFRFGWFCPRVGGWMFVESVCVYVSGLFFALCIRRGCQADGLHRCLHHVCVHMSVCKYFCVCMCV